MSLELGKGTEQVAWVGNRHFIVPPDIIAVRRVSPVRPRKRTPWRPRPEGEPICRAGDRDWLCDRVFVDPHAGELRSAYGASITVHASCLVGLLVLFTGQSAPGERPVRVSDPMRMPAFVAMFGANSGGGGHPARGARATPAVEERPSVVPSKPRPRAMDASNRGVAPPPKPAVATLPDSPPLQAEAAAAETRKSEIRGDADESITRENVAVRTADASVGSGAGGNSAMNGAGGGAGWGGNGGGGSDGVGGTTAGIAMSPGPYRLGNGIEPPRKIKEVRPIYPSDAMALRTLGTVVVEAVIGADGLVHDARIVQSIPLLDRAALEAVRQWQFTPARLNGSAVAVIITILVQFSIY
jgi:protein TonB